MTLEVLKLRQPSRARLVDDVYRSLEEAILSGRMRPGDRIIETWIADQLEVSRTTVREALLMLERQGYVVSEPRRGTFVTRIANDEALDLCYNRALLESFAVQTGFARIDEHVLATLTSCVERMRNCRLPDDVPTLIQIDLAFHHTLIDIAGSHRLTDMWSSLNGQIGALVLRGLEHQQASIDDVAALHQKLIDTIRSGDAQATQQCVIEHYVRTEERDAVRNTIIRDVVDSLAPDYEADFHSKLP